VSKKRSNKLTTSSLFIVFLMKLWMWGKKKGFRAKRSENKNLEK